MPHSNDPILTLAEVADYLRVSHSTVWRWCQTNKLPAFRVGRGWRVRFSSLEQLIDQSTTEAYLPLPHASVSEPKI